MDEQELWQIRAVDHAPELAEDGRALAAVVTHHDRVNPLNERGERILAGHLPGLHLVACEGGELVAYAQIDTADGSAQLMVHPDQRREGIATALTQTAQVVHPGVSWWSFGTLPGAVGLATRLGLQPERQLLRMELGPEVSVGGSALPEGVGLSTFTTDDLEDLVDTNALAFAGHPEQGAMTHDDVRDRMAEPWFDPRGLFLARNRERLLGFHWTKLVTEVRDGVERRIGEVYVLGVHPFEHGRGLGRHLLQVGLDHLRQQGAEVIELYVEADLPRVVQMYERAGFVEANRDTLWA